jgi:hypothetical protein
MIRTVFQSERRLKIWLYFVDFRLRYALAVILFGLILVETVVGKGVLLIGLAWTAGALALGRVRPSDQVLDEIFSHDLEAQVKKAERSLEPLESRDRAEPLAIHGPIELDASASHRLFTRPRTGKDRRRRSPVNRVVVVVPMEEHLGIYSCHYDSLRDLTSQVAVEEHHYRDVVSVVLEEDLEVSAGTRHRGHHTARGGDYVPTQVFSLEFTNGRRLSIPVSVGPPGEGETPLITGLDRTVRAIRTLMRDKR